MAREPMRVIEGNAKPFEAFWRFRDAAESESGTVELEFFGPISEYSWWGDEITPAVFKQQLNERGGGGPVTLLVNSPGGEVIAASVIRSILQEYPGKVTADIVGLAASAATIVVTGADVIRMRESALFMIHDPSGIAMGTAEEIKGFLDVLKTVKDSILDTYSTKTGLARDQLSKMMSAETWMTAREAAELGFVDEVVTGSITKAPMTMRAGFMNCLSNYGHVPAEMLEMNVLAEPVSNVPDEAVAEKAADAQRLRNYLAVFGRGEKN